MPAIGNRRTSPAIALIAIAQILILGASVSWLWAQPQTAPPKPVANYYSSAEPLHSATEALQSAIRALASVKSVEYEVRTLPAGRPPQPAPVLFGRTRVLATVGSPIRYRARFQSEDPPSVELAVSDGEKVRFSAQGKLEEHPTRTMEDNASAGALPTLQLFDVERYREALASRNVLYAGQDDIEGELCYVVAVSALFPDEAGSDTFYY